MKPCNCDATVTGQTHPDNEAEFPDDVARNIGFMFTKVEQKDPEKLRVVWDLAPCRRPPLTLSLNRPSKPRVR